MKVKPKRQPEIDGLFYIKSLKDMGYSFEQLMEWTGVSYDSLFYWYHRKRKPLKVMNRMLGQILKPIYKKIIDNVEPQGQVIVQNKSKNKSKK